MIFCLTGQGVIAYLDILLKCSTSFSSYVHDDYMETTCYCIIRWWYTWRDNLETLISVLGVHFSWSSFWSSLKLHGYEVIASPTTSACAASLFSEPRASRILVYLQLSFWLPWPTFKPYMKESEVSRAHHAWKECLTWQRVLLSVETTEHGDQQVYPLPLAGKAATEC